MTRTGNPNPCYCLTPIPGIFSARRLREFVPKEGSKLAQAQVEWGRQAIPQGAEGREDDDGDPAGEENTRLRLAKGAEDAATEEGGTWSSELLQDVT